MILWPFPELMRMGHSRNAPVLIVGMKNAAFLLEDNLAVCNKAIRTLEHDLPYIFLLYFLRLSDNLYLQQNYVVLETVLFMFPLLSNKYKFH